MSKIPFESQLPEEPLNRDGSRPVQPVKVSYTTSWLYFLMAMSLLVAWYFPAKIVVTRLLWPPAVEQGPRDAYAFAALAYEGVSSKETELSPAGFRDHVRALEANGYVPITLRDVRRLMLYNEPVPRRAVLVTFDHGRRTSYFGVKSHLRRAGWNAVMFLWTKPIEEHDQSSLLWPYIRMMVRSRAWEIGAQSYNGFTPVRANAAGRTGNFMTTPRWLENEQRLETPVEFATRVRDDHTYTLGLIEQRVGSRPIAYAYPYGDFGQFQTRGNFMRQVNLTSAAQFYDLGFVAGNLAINTRYSDARRLNRLRVRPEWSGNELVAYLERSWPRESPELAGTAEEIASAWIVDWGEMELEGSRMSLRASEQTTGAKMWLGGSDLARDFYARVDFRLHEGQMGLYLRASADEEKYVYLGVDTRGEAWLREKRIGVEEDADDQDYASELGLWLRQKHVSLDRFTLASSQTRMEPRDIHTLELFVRDQLLYAMIDGVPMFQSHIRLRGEAKPGMLGISVWDSRRGRARVDIAHVTLRNQPPALATWQSTEGYSPHIIQWIHRNSYQMTRISPPWISFSASGQPVRDQWDNEIYDRLARIYHLDLTPTIRITEEEWLQRLPPGQLANQVADLKLSSVFVNLDGMRNPAASRVAAWLQAASAALREQGAELLVRLPSVLERPATINSIKAIAPALQIVSSPTSALMATEQGRQLTDVQIETVPELAHDDDLPLYYELMALPSLTEEDQGLQTRAVTLEQEGLAAFIEGEYDRAIIHWQEWREIEPHNPRPVMLMGDAYLRLNDTRSAIEYYNDSLELDPGQIALALRRSRILERDEREEEAMQSLNLYARLFPDHPEVLLAQAQWLQRRNRTSEARKLVERVVQLEPYNLEAITMQVRLAATPEERMRFVNRMVEQGQRPEMHYELGQAIWQFDLLSIPEGDRLGELVERISRDTTDERVRLLYHNLRRRREVVKEGGSDTTLSDHWWVTGGTTTAQRGRLRLQADPVRTEVTARLLGSERLRDLFVEATIHDWSGAFWLYALRTENQMVRFGFEEPGRLHLQIWREGRATVNEIHSVAPLQNGDQIRLEVRGNGVRGLVNNRPVGTPVALPRDLWLGWAGLSVFDSRRGQGGVSFDRLSAGPLPLRMALLSADTDTLSMDETLTALRAHAPQLTDFAPAWFTIRPNGDWVSREGENARLLRMFGRLHRLRLMPLVDVLSGPDMPVRDLLERARTHQVDGFILRFPTMPTPRWFEQMEEQMGMNRLDIFVLVEDGINETVTIRAFSSALDLVAGSREGQTLPRKSGALSNPAFNRELSEWSRDAPAVMVLK